MDQVREVVPADAAVPVKLFRRRGSRPTSSANTHPWLLADGNDDEPATLETP
jgi:hypothetical protein